MCPLFLTIEILAYKGELWIYWYHDCWRGEKEMSTHPQRKGCWKNKIKIIHPFKKKKEVGGKEKKLSGHSIRECDWWGK